jgi:hypothetical protein
MPLLLLSRQRAALLAATVPLLCLRGAAGDTEAFCGESAAIDAALNNVVVPQQWLAAAAAEGLQAVGREARTVIVLVAGGEKAFSAVVRGGCGV